MALAEMQEHGDGDVGGGDAGMQGCGDAGTQGCGDAVMRWTGDAATGGRGGAAPGQSGHGRPPPPALGMAGRVFEVNVMSMKRCERQ
jgi:hypothetical protein